MEFDPLKYSSTSFDSMGPAIRLLDMIDSYNIDYNASLRIVDLGCGPGNSTILIAKKFPKSTVIGIDIVPEMIEHAKKSINNNNNNNNNEFNKNIKFFIQDLNQSFEQWNNNELKSLLLEKTIDIIFSNYALQWIFHPFILAETMKKIITPKTGLFAANILFSDILSIVDKNNNQYEYDMIERYLKYPTEQKFISDWIYSLKKNGNFNDIHINYWQPISLYPEKYYSYIKIPLLWHEKFIIPNVSEDVHNKMSQILKNLILKKRIKRIIPRQKQNGNLVVVNEENEENDIEIEQQLWTLIARPCNNDNIC